jgi:hypothetical protein
VYYVEMRFFGCFGGFFCSKLLLKPSSSFIMYASDQSLGMDGQGLQQSFVSVLRDECTFESLDYVDATKLSAGCL